MHLFQHVVLPICHAINGSDELYFIGALTWKPREKCPLQCCYVKYVLQEYRCAGHVDQMKTRYYGHLVVQTICALRETQRISSNFFIELFSGKRDIHKSLYLSLLRCTNIRTTPPPPTPPHYRMILCDCNVFFHI